MATTPRYTPNKSYTIYDDIRLGKSVEMSHGNMQFKVKIEDTIYPYETLFTRYHRVLKDYIMEETLSDDDYEKYYQQPKLLSMDLYGTPELWSGLMYINNIVSVTNFTKKTLKVFTTDIMEALQEVVTIYNDDLNTNRKEVYGE